MLQLILLRTQAQNNCTQKKDAADAADNLSLCLQTNHSRDPQKEEDESSHQPLYSAVNVTKTPQALQPAESGLSSSTVTLNASADSGLTEEGIIYSAVQVKLMVTLASS
ncbi:uncharacterized protein AKAME5_001944300 [Lates japonicus]|uniref:Uncharacterized protein n=1 Tax=Lates japonicus TaxID=270547 RepID=A0AAD3N7N7_LATJO|nr:uncharacterized protein AKAME5_001944300 [Lates japonicus]